MSKNSIVPFLKDYLIKFLTRPFLLDTNENKFIMKENNENKAKALEENKKNYSSENSTPQNGEDIISNEDAEKLEGGIKHEDLERPSEGSLGGIICCNG